MDERDRFRFLLHDAATADTLTLTTPPAGWQDSGVTLQRGTGGGINRTYTLPLGFVKEAKEWLDTRYEAGGVEADVLIRVDEADVTTEAAPLVWRRFYDGRLALIQYQREPLISSCHIEQPGFAQRLTAGRDTPVDLLAITGTGPTGQPLGAPPSPVIVTLHSRGITRFLEAYSSAVEVPQLPVSILSGPDLVVALLTLGWDSTKGKNELPGATSGPSGFAQFPPALPVPLFEAEEAGPYELSVHVAGHVLVRRDAGGGSSSSDFDRARVVFAYRLNTDPEVVLFDYEEYPVGGNFNCDVAFDYSASLNLVPGDQVYLYGLVSLSDFAIDPFTSAPYPFVFGFNWQGAGTEEAPESHLTISARTTFAPTPCTGLLYYEALRRAIEGITGEPDGLRSSLMQRVDSTPPAELADGLWSRLVYTDGFRLRQFPLTVKPLLATVGDLLDSYCVLTGAAWAIVTDAATSKQYVSVEPRAAFFPPLAGTPDLVFEDVEVTVAARPESIYNEAEIGFAVWESETLNGLDDTNARHRYALPISQHKATYSAISKYIASGYVIELTRRKPYREASNEDTARDTAGFVLLVERPEEEGDPWSVERTGAFDPAAFANILAPEDAYNLRLAPGLIALRHLDRLSPSVARQVGPVMRCAQAQGNGAAQYRLLSESAGRTNQEDIPVTSIAHLPDQLTATVPAAYAARRGLLLNPYQLIGLVDGSGARYAGWVVEAKVNPVPQTIDLTLLRIR